MNRIGMAIIAALLLSSQAGAEEQLVLKTQRDMENYIAGINIVKSLQQKGGEINLDVVIQGMKDGLTGENLLTSEDELRKILAARLPETAEKQAANQHDKTRTTSADAGQKNEPAVQQKQDHPERGDEQFPVFVKGPVDGQILPVQANVSVAERGQYRNTLKLRALELRRRMIEERR